MVQRMSQDSVADFLDAHDMRSDFEARKHLAEKYGVGTKVVPYTGTAEQNHELLSILQSSALSKTWAEAKAALRKLV